jgi:hypothetical protein
MEVRQLPSRFRPMDQCLRDRMLVHYNERASQYEEAYALGTGTASITDPTVFTTEIGEPHRIRVLTHYYRGTSRVDVGIRARSDHR